MNKFLIGCIAFCSLLQFTSCDEPTLVGKDLIPDDDALVLDSLQFDNFSINMFRDDSILNSSVSNFWLGKSQLPGVGESVANFYSEFFFGGNMNRLENAVFDSIVLYLRNTGFEGDSTVAQTINIYKLTDSLRSETEGYYYLKDSIPYGDLIGTITDAVYSSDSVFVNGVRTSSHLKATMDFQFGQDLFTQLNDSILTTNKEFQEYFPGIAFRANESNTGAGWFQMMANSTSPDLSGFQLFYHNDEDTSYIRFPLSPIFDYIDSENTYYPGSQNINQVVTSYSNATILDQLNQSVSGGNEVNYLQSGNGVYLEIDFQELLTELQDDEVVNFAEFKLKPSFDQLADTIYLPQSIILGDGFVENSNGEKTGAILGIDGSNVSGTPTNGRIYDGTNIAYLQKLGEGDYQYRFQMPSTLQSMHQGIISPKLYLLSSNRATKFTYFKFNKTDLSMKVIYSKK